MQFKKKSKAASKPLDTFVSIEDTPIKVWFDIHKTGDCRLLLKQFREVSEKEMADLWIVWEKIYDEYILEFGLSEEFLEDLNNLIELANYKAEFVITGNRYFKTMIQVQEETIKMTKTNMDEPPKLELILAKVSKYYGFKLSSRELTIAEYYSYLKAINNAG
jgi:nitrate reductase beta subunit